jgi:hypothetical protein
MISSTVGLRTGSGSKQLRTRWLKVTRTHKLLVTVLIFVVRVERKLTGGGIEQHRSYALYAGCWDKVVAVNLLGSHVVAGSRALLAPTRGRSRTRSLPSLDSGGYSGNTGSIAFHNSSVTSALATPLARPLPTIITGLPPAEASTASLSR